jgi:hypothetical protein
LDYKAIEDNFAAKVIEQKEGGNEPKKPQVVQILEPKTWQAICMFRYLHPE